MTTDSRGGLIISNGILIDGSGSAAQHADLRIVNDTIAEVGQLETAAATEIDATGMIVAPGFIDIHSHSDYTLLVDPRAESSVYQGVTTEIIGNCGHGCFPLADSASAPNSIYGFTGSVPLNWHSIVDYFGRLERAVPAVNVATLIPNGQLRRSAMATGHRTLRDLPAMHEMKALLEAGLEAGAWGFSTGLEYPIEQDTTLDEIVDLCRIVRRHGGVYATHTRQRDSQSVEAVVEAIESSRRSGVQLQISHLLPRSGEADGRRCIDAVDQARREGVPVTFDQHTRRYGFTFLKVLLPNELLDGGLDIVREQLRDPARRERLKAQRSIINSGDPEKWRRIRLLPDKRYPELRGRYFSELSESYGREPMEIALDLLLETLEDTDDPLMVITDCYSEQEQADTFSHELCVPGSDATALCTSGPLSGSTFPGAYSWASWFFRFMVRERSVLTREQAVRKLTSEPAGIIGLKRRGLLRPGYYADIAIFDPESFTESITLEDQNRLAMGVRDVIVNGEFCLRNGTLTGRRSGRVLKSGDR